jgi:hypothetical protein
MKESHQKLLERLKKKRTELLQRKYDRIMRKLNAERPPAPIKPRSRDELVKILDRAAREMHRKLGFKPDRHGP